VLLPGWASDCRIFTPLDLGFNYLVPLEPSPFNFEKSLLAALKEYNINRISLFGWSLGGFVAAKFASSQPGLIDELILVSVRKRYKEAELAQARKALEKNKKGYLAKFYARCFSDQKELSWFKKNLLKYYCRELSLDYLLRTLDYLKNCEMKPELLDGTAKIKIIHGENDRIAPLQEALDIKNKLPRAKFVGIKGAGHIPFLKKGFGGYL
jgi:pimeloyl-ACP methyl ester carboxylesterase